jgi:TPR repeat protein
MVEQVPQYRSDDPDVGAFDENTADYRVAPYKLQQSGRTEFYPENSVPLFLADDNGEADPSEYITPLRKKRRASIASWILAGVLAAAAVAIPFAPFSSDATRDIGVTARALVSAAFLALPAATQSDRSQLTARSTQLKENARPSAPENQTPSVRTDTTAAVAPTREEITMAYQSALPSRAPAEFMTPKDAIHPLDSNEIASLLRRGDALIASGDFAAARLVLRRAADAGDARAAMTLAETYDPAILEKLGVHGLVPNVAMARDWYEKAKKFGAAEAPQRLEMLASKQH